ncbi:hypothetical protein GCM10022378_19410 [Salinicoccus jeotgali]|uniref:Uncharacterized protein n=1 Tax=Salinicoccus jeotgali TaxID=381634 RepID=A0ABP7F4J0_9STAP
MNKVIDSYDVHVHGQLMRIVQTDQLDYGPEGFDVRQLMAREPRGSKYVNLMGYHMEGGALHTYIDSFAGVHNQQVLLKTLVSTLVDRGRLPERETYSVICDGRTFNLKSRELASTPLAEVAEAGKSFRSGDKTIALLETDVALEIDHLAEIKETLGSEGQHDYTVYINRGRHLVFDAGGDIVAHPVHEVISLLHSVRPDTVVTAFNGAVVEVDEGMYHHPYFFIANSQFYIDETDIYTRGFIIK